MIILENLSLAFGDQIIFDAISCNITKNNRIGLVGRNGSGKSTLLKILAGRQSIDDGKVTVEKGATIGYMPQEVVLQSEKTIFDEAFSAFEKIVSLLDELHECEEKIEHGDASGELVERYAELQHDLLEFDVEGAKLETKKVLAGLGFADDRLDEPVKSLSVGWRMRVVLAKLLLQKADFYLFDEPTNHLDIVTKDWFMNFLQNAPFGFMLVCHDRYFLDHLCTKIVDLEHGEANWYHGNYTNYLDHKEQRVEERAKAAEKQQKEIAKKMKTVERFRASASKSKMAQSMLKKLQKVERIQVSKSSRDVSFSFPPIERAGKVVLDVQNVSHAFGDKKIFTNVSFEVERGEKVALVAANGVGKTTLFNIMTGRLPLQDGHVSFGYNVSHALFEQEQDKVLHADSTILNEVESACTDSHTRSLVRKFLGSFLFSGDDVDKKIRVLSGGEKNRVAMTKVLLQQANVLLLDEPTNHLDIQSKEILLRALNQFEGTVIFVSHDRDFLDKLATRILELTPDGVVSYPGNYESYLYQKEQNALREQVPPASQATPGAARKKNTTKSNKELYELRRELQKTEGKIDRLEKKIVTLNIELEKLTYGTDEFSKVYEQLTDAQKQLEEATGRWEELGKALE